MKTQLIAVVAISALTLLCGCQREEYPYEMVTFYSGEGSGKQSIAVFDKRFGCIYFRNGTKKLIDGTFIYPDGSRARPVSTAPDSMPGYTIIRP